MKAERQQTGPGDFRTSIGVDGRLIKYRVIDAATAALYQQYLNEWQLGTDPPADGGVARVEGDKMIGFHTPAQFTAVITFTEG